jgi:hypothetical protein
MPISCKDLRELVVRPTLQHLRLWSPAAEDLILGTAAQESAMGTYLAQLNGPALGIYQMEPATHDDIWNNFLHYKDILADNVQDLLTGSSTSEASFLFDGSNELIGNLYYATAMCRIHYLRVPEMLPVHKDIKGYAAYWKKYYNTELGEGTEEEFIANYKKYVK